MCAVPVTIFKCNQQNFFPISEDSILSSNQHLIILFRTGRLSISRFEISSLHSNLLLYVVPPSPSTLLLTAWIRKDKAPDIIGYTEEPRLTEDVADYTFNLPNAGASNELEKYRIFIPNKELKGTGQYFFGVLANSGNSKYNFFYSKVGFISFYRKTRKICG